jgi:phosphatidylglycerol:prolipoprotein diacylglycerol transferase
VYPAFGELEWITPYGLMLVLALLTAWASARRRAPAHGIDATHVDLAVPLIFLVSLAGAELISLIHPGDLETAGTAFRAQGRFRLLGLFAVGVPALFVYSRLIKRPFPDLLDLFALPCLLWLAVVRIGCFMAGCCWGDLAVDPHLVTAVEFPAGSPVHQQHLALGLIGPLSGTSLPVHPVQLYEWVGLLALVAALSRVKRDRLAPGTVWLLALAAYSIIRFLLEYLRADNTVAWAGLTFTQLACVVIFAVAAPLAYIGFSPTKQVKVITGR